MEQLTDEQRQLVVENIEHVRRLAWRYVGLGVPYDDLVQEGCLALVVAVRRFDAGRGVKFITYAGPLVVRFMQRALVKQRGALSGTIYTQRSARRLWDVLDRVEVERGGAVGQVELAAEAGLSERRFLALLRAELPLLDLDEYAHMVASDDDVDAVEAKLTVEQLMSKVPSHLRVLLRLRFWEGLSLYDVSRRYGISRERVRQLELKALKAMAA